MKVHLYLLRLGPRPDPVCDPISLPAPVRFTHLPRDDGYFGDGGFSEGEQQLGSVPDDASVLLGGTCYRAQQQLPG